MPSDTSKRVSGVSIFIDPSGPSCHNLKRAIAKAKCEKDRNAANPKFE